MHVSLERSPNLTHILLVRHGRSTFNDQQRYQGSSDDAVLTESGWLQAQQIGAWLPLDSIDAVYASPLKRVQQTVQGIWARRQRQIPATDVAVSASMGCRLDDSVGMEAIALPLHTSPLLREVDLPDWQGLTYETVKQRSRDAYQCWKQRPYEFQQGGRYPIQDLYTRAQTFWDAVLPLHAGQRLLVVSHGGTNHALISTALGLPPEFHHCLQQSNGGVSLLTYDVLQQQFQLQSLNVTQHLGEALPKLKAGKQGIRLLLLPTGAGFDSSEAQEMLYRYIRDPHLSGVTLDFCLVQTSERAPAETQILRQSQPQHVPLQDDLINAWRTLMTQSFMTPAGEMGLLTGVAIAPSASLQTLMAQVIAPGRSLPLTLKPATFSIIHIPGVHHRSILQAINAVPSPQSMSIAHQPQSVMGAPGG